MMELELVFNNWHPAT